MKQKNRARVLGALALAVLVILAAGTLLKQRNAPSPQSSNPKIAASTDTRRTAVLSPAQNKPEVVSAPALDEATISVPETIADPLGSKPDAKPAAQPKKPGGVKKLVQDPIAREALAWTGADPYAEEYWFTALENDALSQSERQDLVDDLNEEGLPDPKHPTVEDLPLLLARLELLEEAELHFADRYDFREPRDDLLQLIRIALGSRETVH